jgi:hypothetical protein
MTEKSSSEKSGRQGQGQDTCEPHFCATVVAKARGIITCDFPKALWGLSRIQ